MSITAQDYERCIHRKGNGSERHIECRLGLWAVSGHSLMAEELEREAMRYWWLYYSDGEYDALLANGDNAEDKPFAQEHNWGGKPNPDYDCS